MCGFAGFVSQKANKSMRTIVEHMVSTIVHRGPDDSGLWVDKSAGVSLGHRRLSIVDLSLAGHQPMESVSNRYVMVFNGEIYNHLLLREELSSASTSDFSASHDTCVSFTSSGSVDWKGHSDTETLLSCFLLLRVAH